MYIIVTGIIVIVKLFVKVFEKSIKCIKFDIAVSFFIINTVNYFPIFLWICVCVCVWGGGGGQVVRWCWVNFQCRGVLQFGLQ